MSSQTVLLRTTLTRTIVLYFMIPASLRDGVTEEYVRMVAVNATPRAMTTKEIERESAEDEEMTEVRRCWKTGDWSAA